MEQLKKNGFLIAVGAMVVFLLAFAYMHVFRASASYNAKADSLKRVAAQLKSYASRKPEELPTEDLLAKRNDEKEKLQGAWASGEQFYAEIARKLEELRFQPDGEVYSIGDEAGISNAFMTAVTQLNDAYKKIKDAYVKKVFPPEALEGLDTNWPSIAIQADFTTPEQRREAAARCRIARAIFRAAMAADWGGMTFIGFEKRAAKRTAVSSTKKSKSRSSRKRSYRRSSRRKKKEVKEVKPVDPRTLYEKVKVTVAGEMRFQDLGPFLYQLYQQAQDPKDPVLFVVERVALTKQPDRLLRELYDKQYPSEREARQAPVDAEVKVPTATVRVVLSALKWKGLPKEQPQP